jgi:flagellar motor switch protein FliM
MDDVQTYAFGRGESQAPVMLSGVDRLGEKLGRRLRALVEPIAGVRPNVVAQPAQLLEFGQWAVGVPAMSSIGCYRLNPLKGQTLLRLDATMISTLVDCFYGGIGNRPLPSRGEFTPTEDRLIIRLSDSIMARLVECWADILPIEPSLIVRETGVGFASSAQPAEPMILQRFAVSITRDQSWSIDLLMPLTALRGVEALMGTKVHDEGAQDDLMQLKAGDVIPVNIGRSLPLIVGDRIVAHGTIGEQEGRAAFQIEKLVQGQDQ